ncbi:MAG: hemolysin family protein [Bacteroidales bacterium]|nr:hemolysin family protein [Candidatus Latescibacterota bacterium]
MTGNLILAVSVIILLFLSAFFSGSETALFSLSRLSVSGMIDGGVRRRRVSELLEKPRMLLVTILFGNLLVNIASTSAVTALAIKLFGERGLGYSMVLMTFLILIFGEITPKSLALKHGPVLAPMLAGPLKLLMWLFWPVRIVLGWIADSTVNRSKKLFGESHERYESSELATAVEMGHIDGVFDEFEKDVLVNFFHFTKRGLSEILTPRVEVFSLDADTGLQDAIIQVRAKGYSRIPLFEDSAENIVGILNARDMLGHDRDEKIIVRDLMKPVTFVPETKKVRDLLGELLSLREHVAIAVDEHGSFEGIVTLEDILEDIFGEIRDRLEPRVDEFNLIDNDRIVVEGAMKLEDLNDRFGTMLDSLEVETIGGYLIEHAGRIPREGEVFRVGELRFLILSAEPVRINKVKIERQKNMEDRDEHD